LTLRFFAGLSGMDALPFVDMIEADKIDLLLISHFHLDHAGALPWLEIHAYIKGLFARNIIFVSIHHETKVTIDLYFGRLTGHGSCL
jgi:glyoxylase-like metal-dependent hydrolase (beta-lactamase superfamily II)